jgi:hypothetical protein
VNLTTGGEQEEEVDSRVLFRSLKSYSGNQAKYPITREQLALTADDLSYCLLAP